jgi:OmpA-OmpF porin, OOP family
MKTFSRAALTIALLVAAVVISTGVAVRAQTIESSIQTTGNRLTESKRARLNLIAPKAYEEAVAEFNKAQERFARGGKIEDIQRRLAKINQKLTQCEELQEIGNVLLREAFAARDEAIAANSPKFASELWAQAERSIREAGRKVEDGKQNDARKRASKAIAIYRDAELLAIRTDILGSAKAARDRARSIEAEELARKTMNRAERDLAAAEQILQGDRSMKAQALELAESSREGFRHAAIIATIATKISDDRKVIPEEVVLSYESQISRIANTLSYDPAFSGGIESVADQIIAAAKSLAADREQLVTQVADLQSRIDELNDELGTLQDRDKTLQRKERYDGKLEAVRSIFAPNEAEILLIDDELIIRLYALSFPVGSSEIRPQNFALLTRVQRALREYPAAGVTVEGHTDAQGDEAMNQSLSVRRSEAVRAYLLASMGIEPQLLSARGYGESRPIASNEVEAGRAKNRRIDVVIDLGSAAR